VATSKLLTLVLGLQVREEKTVESREILHLGKELHRTRPSKSHNEPLCEQSIMADPWRKYTQGKRRGLKKETGNRTVLDMEFRAFELASTAKQGEMSRGDQDE